MLQAGIVNWLEFLTSSSSGFPTQGREGYFASEVIDVIRESTLFSSTEFQLLYGSVSSLLCLLYFHSLITGVQHVGCSSMWSSDLTVGNVILRSLSKDLVMNYFLDKSTGVNKDMHGLLNRTR